MCSPEAAENVALAVALVKLPHLQLLHGYDWLYIPKSTRSEASGSLKDPTAYDVSQSNPNPRVLTKNGTAAHKLYCVSGMGAPR